MYRTSSREVIAYSKTFAAPSKILALMGRHSRVVSMGFVYHGNEKCNDSRTVILTGFVTPYPLGATRFKGMTTICKKL